MGVGLPEIKANSAQFQVKLPTVAELGNISQNSKQYKLKVEKEIFEKYLKHIFQTLIYFLCINVLSPHRTIHHHYNISLQAKFVKFLFPSLFKCLFNDHFITIMITLLVFKNHILNSQIRNTKSRVVCCYNCVFLAICNFSEFKTNKIKIGKRFFFKTPLSVFFKH